MEQIEAVPAESLDSGAVLWSERKGEVLGHVVQVEEIDGGERVRIHFRHAVNETQSTVSAQTVGRDALIPVVCAGPAVRNRGLHMQAAD